MKTPWKSQEKEGQSRTLTFVIELNKVLPKLPGGQKIHPQVEESQASLTASSMKCVLILGEEEIFLDVNVGTIK